MSYHPSQSADSSFAPTEFTNAVYLTVTAENFSGEIAISCFSRLNEPEIASDAGASRLSARLSYFNSKMTNIDDMRSAVFEALEHYSSEAPTIPYYLVETNDVPQNTDQRDLDDCKNTVNFEAAVDGATQALEAINMK